MNIPALAVALRAAASALEEGPQNGTEPSVDAPLSAVEASRFLGVSPSTITVAVQRGDLQAARYGKRAVRIMRSELNRYREARLTK